MRFLDDYQKEKYPKFVLEDYLFKEQLAFVNDSARFATAVCSVRAGKTTACAADLVNTALTLPGTTGLYITLARTSAKRIVWPELHRIAHDFKIQCQFNEAELSIKFPNRSVIYLSGANTESEMEKLRGLSNVALVYIDESQAFRAHLKELVEDVLVKRLYDLNGRLRLIGTPGPLFAGYFYEASQSDKWSHHHWTIHNNIWIERKSGLTASQLIQQDMDRQGVTIDHPSIQRECFGRWIYDPTALLLQYDSTRNHYDSLPQGKFVYILGLDFGFNDADSFSVLGWNEGSPNTYLIEEIVREKQTYEQMCSTFETLNKAYPFSRFVGDPGGGGKKLIESLNQRFSIQIEAAEKTEKIANYGLLNNALRTGRFFAKRDSRFAQDCNLLERDRDKSTPERTIVKGHSDAVDSVLYPFKHSPAYYWEPPKEKAKRGTPEFDKIQEDILLEHHIEKLEKERQIRDNQTINWNLDPSGIAPWNKWDDL